MGFGGRGMKELAEVERQMGRLLRNTSLTKMVQMQSGSDWLPAVDVYETANALYVCVDTAGIDVNNLSISIESGSVTITGRRHWPLRENLCRVHQLEIEHGYFKRTVSFPLPVDVKDAASRCVNGILEIRMPKAT